MPQKKLYLTVGAAVVILAVIVMIIIARNNSLSSGQSPALSASSSEQENVDTSLSLAPPTNTATTLAPPLAIISPPHATANPAYSGCKLDLEFATTGGNLQAAGTMNYTLAAKNLGNTACKSASISVYYANNESFASSSPRATAAGYYWQLGNLAAGKEADITLITSRTAALASGNVTNEACLSANNGADACSNSAATVAVTTGVIPSPPSPVSISAPSGISPVSTPALASFAPSSTQEAGVWEWTSLSDMTTAQMQQVVDEAAANNFNVIYITVDEYITISNISDVTKRQQQLQTYDQDVATFLSLAAQKNIAVDAEAGSKDWAEPQNTWEPLKIMLFVATYNQTHAQKFRGVQYDIEPYLLPQYNNSEGTVLTQYVSLIDQLVQQDKTENVPLGIVVPHFYDSNEMWTPEVTVDGITAYTYAHVVRLLNELPAGDGRILIMAYRNFATGSDSAIALSSPEIKEADATNVKVIVAQETGPVTPSYVTFSGTSRAALFSQIGAIDQAFASDPSFRGIAIDYLDPYLELQ